EDAAKRLGAWHLAGGPPVPNHSKLENYNRRRTQHLIKLSMVSAVSRTGEIHLALVDIERGIAWLMEVERLMPDIFRAMVGKSDSQVLEELYGYLVGVWRMHKEKAVNERFLFSFLTQRVPSEKIEKLIQIAERSNMITRMAGTNDFRPN